MKALIFLSVLLICSAAPTEAQAVWGAWLIDTPYYSVPASNVGVDADAGRLDRIRNTGWFVKMAECATKNYRPTTSDIVGNFGERLRDSPDKRLGIELRSNMGSGATALSEGIVIQASYLTDYGYYVIVDHGGGVLSVYGHLLGISVRRGDRVEAGAKIGYAGTTGYAFEPCLFLSVIFRGEYLNPMLFFESQKPQASLWGLRVFMPFFQIGSDYVYLDNDDESRDRIANDQQSRKLARYFSTHVTSDLPIVSFGVAASGGDHTQLGAVYSIPENADIPSVGRGVVIATFQDEDLGYAIVVDHGDSLLTFYGHLKRAEIRTGDHVEAGTPVGKSGSIGAAGESTLFFGMVHHEEYLDPTLFRYFGGADSIDSETSAGQ